ncbi:hypothetical protein BJ165DRAFT_1340044 [Panaeolus papilionaceus]|nr:hypothetical protein BJ165DRAFT_1340044 [Panaeolus papilionaceus]
MSSPIVNTVIPGFSLTNRWLLYTSLMLTPAQAAAGVGSHIPFNLGFLAYNIYQQYLWFMAAKTKQLHALSLLTAYLNMINALTYLGGIPAGNYVLGICNGLVVAALIMMNTITAWISWKECLSEGDGLYRFFFFGWRTLSKGWRNFFLLWQIGDTFAALGAMVYIPALVQMGIKDESDDDDDMPSGYVACSMIFVGPPLVMVAVGWPLIMWIELIVSKNHISSETDMISVYLFIAQVALLILSFVTDLVTKIFSP